MLNATPPTTSSSKQEQQKFSTNNPNRNYGSYPSAPNPQSTLLSSSGSDGTTTNSRFKALWSGFKNWISSGKKS